MENLKRFAELQQVPLEGQSLGKGQGPKAIEKIKKAIQGGTWVVLQNCHLAASFMPDLEKLVEDFSESRISPSFRLWLTSKSTHLFPVSILQRGIKITNEPPKGLKANLKKSWQNDYVNDASFFNGCKKPREFKKLLFGLCFFHAVVQERRKFGPLGWNIPYEFNESDLRISEQQLQMFLNDTPYIPFKALSYLTGECNYGGRVTDDHDRRTLMAILSDFYNEDILEDGHKFSSASPLYYAPSDGDHNSYLTYIDQLPMNQDPDVFGLHENANITKDLAEGVSLFEDFSLTQESGGTGGSGGRTMEQIVSDQARDILAKLPADFNIEEAQKRYPISLMESMNTVLVQELVRFNNLLQVVRTSLVNVQKGLKGEVVMSESLEKMAKSIFDGKIPKMWADKSYPSLKPLGGYVSDLLRRIEFLQKWLDHGPPTVFWISGFYFTQSFLTGTKQNFARRKKIEIDKVEFEFEVMREIPTAPPPIGVYVDGLYLEGARWDGQIGQLADQLPKRLYDKMPVIWFKPVKMEPNKQHENVDSFYLCPVYKTSERKGTLSTTGHSTNYIISIKLPTDQEEKYWIKRGTALFCQLD
ncbi:hypothetical protein AKO1_012707 [Acrasis kona]|uniref:Uncharacterized protein n=1 Tax=Acrasis kona TaxID=1008807 RepID=A0AAW2YXB1_9EUKA